MPLINANNIINYARNYRVVYIGGRYGGGKTALAFRLAYELVRAFDFRYILSNVRCVWASQLDTVALRDGAYVDAVIVLDEGGMYLDTAYSAKEWLAYLRKMNIVLIVPSVLPPSALMRRLSVQRTFNGFAWGLPFWSYGVRLDAGIVKERDWFTWSFPSEIFGVYDTVGMPSDASELLDKFGDWTRQAQKALGYKQASARLSVVSNSAVGGLDNLLAEQSELTAILEGVSFKMSENASKNSKK